jgi:predicted flap endonuclease-1-like 5' DNA nuclease
MSSTHIGKIEGIGPAHSAKLQEIGIKTVETLLEKGATPHGRKELADKLGVGHHHLLKWVNQADLFRINGIGRQYAELLQACGVDSVLELSQRNAEHLHAKVIEINNIHHHVKEPPTATHIKHWIEEAKLLPRIVSY